MPYAHVHCTIYTVEHVIRYLPWFLDKVMIKSKPKIDKEKQWQQLSTEKWMKLFTKKKKKREIKTITTS